MSVSPITFRSIVLEHFAAFMSELGFAVVESPSEAVRFESAKVFFELGHAPYDREVYGRVGRIGAPGVTADASLERLDFGLYLAVRDPDAHLSLCRDVPYACADTEEHVRRVVSYFRGGVDSHGRRLLLAEPAEYSFARDLRFWHAPPSPQIADGSSTQ